VPILTVLTVKIKSDFGELKRDTQEAKSDLSSLGSVAKSVGGSFRSLGSALSLGSATSQLRSLGSGLTTAAAGARTFGSGLLSMGAQLGMTVMGVKELASAAIELTSSMMKPHASLENLTAGLQTLLKSEPAAQSMIAELRTFADLAPAFDLVSAGEGAQKLLAMGFSADQVMPIMYDLGNAIAGMGGTAADLEPVALVFGQINSVGKLTLENLLQLAERGFVNIADMAENAGMSTADFMDAMSKGSIDAATGIDLIRQTMQETFGDDAMANAANTWDGAVAKMQAGLTNLWMLASKPIFDTLKEGVKGFASLLEHPAVIGFAEGTGAAIASAFERIGSFVDGTVMPAMRSLWAIWNDEPGGMLLVALQDLWQAFTDLWAPVEQIGGALNSLIEPLGGVGGAASDAEQKTSLFANVLYGISGIIQDHVIPFVESLKEPLDQMFDAMEGPEAQQLWQTLGSLGEKAGDLAGKAWDLWTAISPIGQLFSDSGNAGATFAGIMQTASIILENVVIPIFDEIGRTIENLKIIIGPIAEQFGKILGDISDSVMRVMPNIKSIIEQVGDGINNIITHIAPIIEEKLLPAIDKFSEKVLPIIENTIRWIDESGILKTILDGVGFVLGLLIEGLANFITWQTDTIAAISEIIGWFTNWGEKGQWLQDRWEEVKQFFIGLWGTIGEIFGQVGQWFADRFNEAKENVTNAFGSIGQWFQDRWTDVKNAFSGAPAWFQGIWQGIKDAFSGVAGWFGGIFQSAIDNIKAVVQPIIDWWNGVYATITGQQAQVSNYSPPNPAINQNPGQLTPGRAYATGVRNFSPLGGMPWEYVKVGEYGEEIIKLPKGSDVYTNTESRAMFGGSGGTPVTYSMPAASGSSAPVIVQHHSHIYLNGHEIGEFIEEYLLSQARSHGARV
jgi:tape measure domain-containing protein